MAADGEYHWERVELPPLQADKARIRLRACELCTGYVMDWYTLRKVPLTPRHELVGKIESLGEGGTSVFRLLRRAEALRVVARCA